MASKHMEEHIIAAHSALLIGYMLLTEEHFNANNSNGMASNYSAKSKKNSAKSICLDSVASEMKDGSFKKMSQIIAKFLEFMKMMVS